MRILVTGGNGFLGAYVVRELVTHDHDVVILDAAAGDENLRLAWDGAPPPLTVQPIDVRDAGAVSDAFERWRPAAVVHLASLLLAASAADPRAAVEVNVLGTANIFEAARRAGVARVAWASSGGLFSGYEGGDVAIDDGSPSLPLDLYSHCKLLCERLGAEYFERFGLDAVALRPSYINGVGVPGGVRSQILRELVVNPVLGRPGTVPFPDDIVPWLDVEEVADAFRVVVEHDGATASRAFNLSPSPAPMGEAMEVVRRLVPGARLTRGAGSQWGEGRPYAPGFGAAMRRELGFQAGRSMPDQLARAVERVQRHRPLIESLYPAAAG